MKRAPEPGPHLTLYHPPVLHPPVTVPNPAARRARRLMLLACLTTAVVCLCAIVAFVVGYFTTMDDSGDTALALADGHSERQLAPYASQPLQRGGTVVVYQDGRSTLGQVAAGANESVLLKRGETLQGLYMVGGKGCVVVSEGGARTVRAHEVVATVESAGKSGH